MYSTHYLTFHIAFHYRLKWNVLHDSTNLCVRAILKYISQNRDDRIYWERERQRNAFFLNEKSRGRKFEIYIKCNVLSFWRIWNSPRPVPLRDIYAHSQRRASSATWIRTKLEYMLVKISVRLFDTHVSQHSNNRW